jgi:hypothetical protein
VSSQVQKSKSVPTAFISYSHDGEEHQQWVIRLATHLRLNGVDAKLDVWEAPLGADFSQFMEAVDHKSGVLQC